MNKHTVTLLLLACSATGVHATEPPKNEQKPAPAPSANSAIVELHEDQNDVYQAVQKGVIQPFSALYQTIDRDLNGRVIKVELDKENGQWIYALRLVYQNSVIYVKYDAATLDMLQIRGRNLHDVMKNRESK